jgi:hypothetical protein
MKCLCAGYENEMKFAVHRQGMKKLCTVRKKNQRYEKKIKEKKKFRWALTH